MYLAALIIYLCHDYQMDLDIIIISLMISSFTRQLTRSRLSFIHMKLCYRIFSTCRGGNHTNAGRVNQLGLVYCLWFENNGFRI